MQGPKGPRARVPTDLGSSNSLCWAQPPYANTDNQVRRAACVLQRLEGLKMHYRRFADTTIFGDNTWIYAHFT